jgi:A/G-specific adenine glycosylase
MTIAAATRAVLPDYAPGFRRALMRWFGKHGRDLPWRHTRDPYAILVSELMLQQTTVTAVIPYFERWMRRFPDVIKLAAASENDVLHAWQGLGYYTRARNLHAAAKRIARDGWPADLEQLPGVGRYTAKAIATFAHDRAVPLVEANIARLLARLTNYQFQIDNAAGVDHLWSTAEALLPKQNASRYNSALMDLGATICVSGMPRCNECPVRAFCTAVDPASLPRKVARASTKRLIENHAYVRRNGSVLLEQAQHRWRGMWILPRLMARPATAAIHRSEFPFTHHKITLTVFNAAELPDNEQHRWFTLSEVATIPLPSPHRRALDALLARAAA